MDLLNQGAGVVERALEHRVQGIHVRAEGVNRPGKVDNAVSGLGFDLPETTLGRNRNGRLACRAERAGRDGRQKHEHHKARRARSSGLHVRLPGKR
jgi:hypothetical protein